MSDWPAYGRSDSSGESPVKVTKYRGKWYPKWELQVEKDTQKGIIKGIEAPVDLFNKLIQKTQR